MCWCDTAANSFRISLHCFGCWAAQKSLVGCPWCIYAGIKRIRSGAQELRVVGSSGCRGCGLVVWVLRDRVFPHRALPEECAPHKGVPKPWGFLHFGCDGRYSSLSRAFLLTSLQARQMCGYLLVVTPGRKHYWIS